MDHDPEEHERKKLAFISTLQRKEKECTEFLSMHTPLPDHCPATWDGVYCWPDVPAGHLKTIFCPDYVEGFDKQRNASRYCTEEASWFLHPEINKSWSNYTSCHAVEEIHLIQTTPDWEYNVTHGNQTIIAEWLPVIKRMSQVGYAVSFLMLLVAFFVLLSVKKLRCPRNTLHMHLFVSFMLRAFMALLKDSLFVDGIGLANNIEPDGTFLHEQSNWECKLVTSIWEYFIVANYTWILMEGMYLHNLIFLAPFSDSSAITLYVLLGWGCPLLVVGSWVMARAYLDDTLCWTTHSKRKLFLIIRIPIIISIVLNFMFFINIVRVLFIKLQSAVSIETRKYRYRKWAKSTLVLVPLFGVHYMVLIGMTYYVGLDPVIEVIWLFCDQLFGSFQGFFVAILYCLINGEVRSELNKRWHVWKSEGENKNTWVPLNQISSKFYHRSTHEDLLTNGLSGGNGAKILRIGMADEAGGTSRQNLELTEEHVFQDPRLKEVDTMLPHELED